MTDPASSLRKPPQAAIFHTRDNIKGIPMRKLLLAVALVAPLLASACNTIAGLGKDVGAVGDAVSDTAEKSK
jgi:predicted small secreted protein